jgi:hypothetical protein
MLFVAEMTREKQQKIEMNDKMCGYATNNTSCAGGSK